MSIHMVRGKNPKSASFSLAVTTPSSVTFATVIANAVNCATVQSDVDVHMTAKWDAAAPTSAGTAATPVDGWDFWVGPSHGIATLRAEEIALTLGLYILSGATANISVTGFVASKNA